MGLWAKATFSFFPRVLFARAKHETPMRPLFQIGTWFSWTKGRIIPGDSKQIVNFPRSFLRYNTAKATY